MKLQSKKTDTNAPAPQHLFTNLEVKVKPHKNKTKFLHARLDTCADVNIMPCSVYQLLFKDPDCTKFPPSDLQFGTYTNNIVKLIGACELYVVHPSTKSIEAVTFFEVYNEESVLISCTGLALGLIKPHASLDHLPPGSNIISSSTDQQINDKTQLNVLMLLEKSQTSKLTTSPKKISDMCYKKEQSLTKFSRKKQDKNCQVNMRPVKPTVYDDKKCQDTKFMQPVQSPNKKSCYKWSMPR